MQTRRQRWQRFVEEKAMRKRIYIANRLNIVVG